MTTTDLSVSYLKPMNAKQYIFRSEYTHVGRHMVRCTGKAIDAETGMLCVTAIASFMVTESKGFAGVKKFNQIVFSKTVNGVIIEKFH